MSSHCVLIEQVEASGHTSVYEISGQWPFLKKWGISLSFPVWNYNSVIVPI